MKKKTLQITIEFPQVEMKHWLLSPRLFILVKVLSPKNLNNLEIKRRALILPCA